MPPQILTKTLNEKFGTERNYCAIVTRRRDLNKKGYTIDQYQGRRQYNFSNSSKRKNAWTKEEQEILFNFYPTNGAKATANKIYESCGIRRSEHAILSQASIHGIKLKNGKGSILEEGTISWRGRGTKKPKRFYIKVKESDGKYKWVPLSRYLFGDEANGKYVIFLDKNYKNINIENLACISPEIMSTLVGNNLYFNDAELTKTAIKWCNLICALKEQGVNVKELIKNMEEQENDSMAL